MQQFRRILLKLSGEALMGSGQFGHDFKVIEQIAESIHKVKKLDIQIAIVVGGGNIWRGGQKSKLGVPRVAADHIGMLATMINGVVLQNAIEKAGMSTCLTSAIAAAGVCDLYNQRIAAACLEKGDVVICVAGTGNPFFTTDSAAALKAIELSCDLLLKGTQTDGIYSADPAIDNQAARFNQISYKEVLDRELQIMDLASIILAREHQLPIRVFSIKEPNNFAKVVQSQGIFTDIRN